MTQAASTDRDPIDPQALAAAVAAWLANPTDEADIVLEAALLEQGVISPADVIAHLVGIETQIAVILGDDTEFWLLSDGTIAEPPDYGALQAARIESKH